MPNTSMSRLARARRPLTQGNRICLSASEILPFEGRWPPQEVGGVSPYPEGKPKFESFPGKVTPHRQPKRAATSPRRGGFRSSKLQMRLPCPLTRSIMALFGFCLLLTACAERDHIARPRKVSHITRAHPGGQTAAIVAPPPPEAVPPPPPPPEVPPPPPPPPPVPVPPQPTASHAGTATHSDSAAHAAAPLILASSAVQSSPTLAMAEPDAVLERDNSWGRLEWRKPVFAMRAQTFSFSIAPKSAGTLQPLGESREGSPALSVTRSRFMSARLQGDGFDVVGNLDQPKDLGNSERSTWTWQVTPKSAGDQELLLIVSNYTRDGQGAFLLDSEAAPERYSVSVTAVKPSFDERASLIGGKVSGGISWTTTVLTSLAGLIAAAAGIRLAIKKFREAG
jgi:hypothetical protein